jgi:hypothetical protein
MKLDEVQSGREDGLAVAHILQRVEQGMELATIIHPIGDNHPSINHSVYP